MTKTDALIRVYMKAAAALVEQALADAAQDDPAGLAELRRAVGSGAMLAMHSTFAPAAGLARLSIEYVEPSGKAHSLLSCDLEQETGDE
jgi:hypothetical protein